LAILSARFEDRSLEPAAIIPPLADWPDLASAVAAPAPLDVSRPVMLLGGRENCLAVARNLGQLGIPVYVSGRAGCHAMRSRYCRRAFPVRPGDSASDAWRRLLTISPPSELKGAIVFAMCDESLEFLTGHGEELGERYILNPFVPELRKAMLDKLETLIRARKVGVPTPNFWAIEKVDDVLAIRTELRFPVMVKPHDSRAFMSEFGRKLFIVEDSFEDVVEKVRLSLDRGLKVMVVEMIPGPDSLLSSYNTYRTAGGTLLYDYTKGVVRRWPVNRGGATMHRSVWLPETAELGRKLFEGIGWQGIGNVEFKRDLRDGQLKIIEVNGRYTAAQRLITEAGVPIDLIAYCHLTGQPPPRFGDYSQSLHFWYPVRDFFAFLQMRRSGQITLGRWLRSLSGKPLLLPAASWRDPLPSLAEGWFTLRRLFGSPRKYFAKALSFDR
jgi:predicted ATP-grasp superfamily ATP-dependent carboligase